MERIFGPETLVKNQRKETLGKKSKVINSQVPYLFIGSVYRQFEPTTSHSWSDMYHIGPGSRTVSA